MHKDCWFHYNLCFSASGSEKLPATLKAIYKYRDG